MDPFEAFAVEAAAEQLDVRSLPGQDVDQAEAPGVPNLQMLELVCRLPRIRVARDACSSARKVGNSDITEVIPDPANGDMMTPGVLLGGTGEPPGEL